MDFHHPALWVSDLERTRAFYEDALGLASRWESVDDDGVTDYYVAGANGIELQFKYDPSRSGDIETGGVDHVAFEVDDVEATVARVTSTVPVDVVREPTTTDTRRGNVARIALVRDPTGYVVEFVERLEG